MELAKLLGISEPYLSEKLSAGDFSPGEVVKIAEFLGRKIGEFCVTEPNKESTLRESSLGYGASDTARWLQALEDDDIDRQFKKQADKLRSAGAEANVELIESCLVYLQEMRRRKLARKNYVV